MAITTVTGDDHKNLQTIADDIARSKKIIFVTGAGVSTNCGIPDFRSADGLYNQVKARYPETASSKCVKGKDMFDCVLFKDPTSTKLFYTFITEFRNSVRKVEDTTTTHKFIRTLAETGRLQRCYTQNIDGLEAKEGLTTDIGLGKGKKSLGKKMAAVVGLPETNEEKGCQVVQLHGDLDLLRCTLCQQTTDYDDEKISILLEGSPPECPKCEEKDTARTNAGKRSLQVGTLRPNIVLYGEENPQADMIGKISSADLSARPDYLIIAGTSLKVHGLKNLVRVFAGSVHAKGGKVIYINKTPGAIASSVWKDVIDYYIEMDCDSFVDDMREKRPAIWERQAILDMKRVTKAVGAKVAGKKRKNADGTNEESDKENASAPPKKKTKLKGVTEKIAEKVVGKVVKGIANGMRKMAQPKTTKKKPLAESQDSQPHGRTPMTPPPSSVEGTPRANRYGSPAVHHTPRRAANFEIIIQTPGRMSKAFSKPAAKTTAAPKTMPPPPPKIVLPKPETPRKILQIDPTQFTGFSSGPPSPLSDLSDDDDVIFVRSSPVVAPQKTMKSGKKEEKAVAGKGLLFTRPSTVLDSRLEDAVSVEQTADESQLVDIQLKSEAASSPPPSRLAPILPPIEESKVARRRSGRVATPTAKAVELQLQSLSVPVKQKSVAPPKRRVSIELKDILN